MRREGGGGAPYNIVHIGSEICVFFALPMWTIIIGEGYTGSKSSNMPEIQRGPVQSSPNIITAYKITFLGEKSEITVRHKPE